LLLQEGLHNGAVKFSTLASKQEISDRHANQNLT